MDDILENVLKAEAEKEALFKSVDAKAFDVVVDEGNLLAVDINPLDRSSISGNQEGYLKELARENTQLLFNQIWQLPINRSEGEIVAELPEPKTLLPREKPVPKPKPATRWEQYAKLKGIQKTKKSNKVWDEEAKEWRPRWGYKRANDETKQWAIEVGPNDDPYEDQFEKIAKAKKERVAKNELQRLRNIARNSKGRVPGVGQLPNAAPDRDHLSRQLAAARTADASKGKFTKDLRDEKPLKNSGKRRKFDSNTGKGEKERALNILKSVNSGKEIFNANKVKSVNSEDGRRSSKKGKGKAGKPKAGKAKAANFKAGKGKKAGNKAGKGRKK